MASKRFGAPAKIAAYAIAADANQFTLSTQMRLDVLTSTCGLSVRRLRAAIDVLEGAKLLRVENGGRRPNIHTLVMPERLQEDDGFNRTIPVNCDVKDDGLNRTISVEKGALSVAKQLRYTL